jgi:ADP-ribosyl-[dinitrogen reductase] hydrolase
MRSKVAPEAKSWPPEAVLTPDKSRRSLREAGGRARRSIASCGYVAHALEASLWSVGRTGDFRLAVLTAANLADDADTTAAITGQLTGALYGYAGIPGLWCDRVAWGPRVVTMAQGLFDQSLNRN